MSGKTAAAVKGSLPDLMSIVVMAANIQNGALPEDISRAGGGLHGLRPFLGALLGTWLVIIDSIGPSGLT